MWVDALIAFGAVAVLTFILLRSSRGTVSSDVSASSRSQPKCRLFATPWPRRRAAMTAEVRERMAARHRGRKLTTPRTIAIEPQDNPGLLLAAMRAFEGSGQISFEGVDPDSALRGLVGATHVQTSAL